MVDAEQGSDGNENERVVAVVRVAYRGKTTSVEVPGGATVAHLAVALERATGASVSTQKILGLKNAGAVVTAGTLVPAKDAHAALPVASVPGLCDSPKPLMMMGSAVRDIEAMDAAAAVDQRVAGFEEEDKRLRRRHRSHVSRPLNAAGGGGKPRRDAGPPSTAEHPYTFATYRALPVPGFVRPTADAALRLLHKLASDPGILGVMAKHRWKVPLLAEMPPEGKVGVSESCVLGYNVNAGQEIHLRLRTDDLKGFRRYARIRETLLHELTHNVWSDHDINFKRLCSQLNVECREFDWKRSGNGAQKLGGAAAEFDDSEDEESWSEDEAMAATRASSGQALGGGGGSGGSGVSAAEAAARAAAARAAAAAEAEMASLARDALREADKTTSSRAPGAWSEEARVSDVDFDNDVEMKTVDEVGVGEDEGAVCTCGACARGPFSTPQTQTQTCLVRPPTLERAAASAAAVNGIEKNAATREGIEAAKEETAAGHFSAPMETYDDVHVTDAEENEGGVGAPVSLADATAVSAEAAEAAAEVEAKAKAAAAAATAAAESTAAEAAAVEASLDDDAARAHAATAEATARADAACVALVASVASPQEAVVALDTLATILGNAMSAPRGPEGDKYRSIRPGNPAFHRRAGRHVGATDLLRAAGFSNSSSSSALGGGGGGGEVVLRLTRDDPALLYIVRSAVCDAAARAKASA